MNENVSTLTGAILTYGSVELCLYQGYKAGETLRIHQNLYMEVVDRVEKADGIVVLGLLPNEGKGVPSRPSCQCVLFTHYYKHPIKDTVDHFTTVARLTFPTETVRRATEQTFIMDLVKRSVIASLAYSPSVRYL